MSKAILILSILLLIIGCAPSRDIVPLPSNGSVDPQLRTSSKIENGVKVTVKTSAWSGSPSSLKNYVTPFYVEIQNNTNEILTFGYDDLVLFSENRTQYNAFPPATVADILKAKYQSGYAYYPYPSISLGTGFFYGRPYYYPWRPYFGPFGFYDYYDYYGYYPYWYPPAYSYRSVDTEDVFTEALIPGSVYPNAKLQGFVYFKKIPKEVQRVTLEVGYNIQGEEGRHTLSFPFELK
ncbi:MAG TPA: hypothetical protein VHT73_17145 [Thermodesulfobacteriota bacterium]|nr:hypothetical protein [Thermodesulfobacteriota bacterium]